MVMQLALFLQISPYSEDDMLGIEPLELHFPFRLNKELSCSLQLTNDTDSYIAFEVQKMSPLPHCTEPREGIIPPRSNCGVDITLQPQDNAPQRANEFIVRSTKVNYGITSEHITTAMFNKYMDNVVDEVNLDVVFDPEVSFLAMKIITSMLEVFRSAVFKTVESRCVLQHPTNKQ